MQNLLFQDENSSWLLYSMLTISNFFELYCIWNFLKFKFFEFHSSDWEQQ